MRRATWGKLLVIALTGTLAWSLVKAASSPDAQSSASGDSEIFTPAHPTALEAVRSFFNWRTAAVQPIAFPHSVHLANGLECDSCHNGTDVGPEASLPSVKFCMSCHMVIAVDRPEIKKIAAYQARGEEIPWVRVYDYNASAHVRFNHGPHIRAEVPCATCHGDMAKQTTAQRVVDMNMGYCIGCHQQRKASVDCVTCHF
jgi:Cytochrome c7 and related cytochrome c